MPYYDRKLSKHEQSLPHIAAAGLALLIFALALI